MTVRRLLVHIHRWTGLCLALFLIPIGLAGSLLVWRAELDQRLNPELFHARSATAPRMSAEQLENLLAKRYPRMRIDLEMLQIPNGSARAAVAGWPRTPGARRITEVFFDPASGEVLGTRNTREPQLNRQEFFPWLYRFHYTLMFGIQGMKVLGVVAIGWLINSLVGLFLTFPRGRSWWRTWMRAWRVDAANANYDTHRASGLWLWPVMIVLALSSVYLNLTFQVFVPAVEFVTAILPATWREPVRSAIIHWQYPLHTGQALGLVGRIAIFIGGVAMVVLSITGIVMSLRSLQRARARRRKDRSQVLEIQNGSDDLTGTSVPNGELFPSTDTARALL